MVKKIAFIAHNHKKADMVSFVMKNKNLIEKTGFEIISTGTTGKFLSESGFDVKRYESGPLGGDAQIASRIVEGKVEMVFFFRDPLNSHAHEVDVNMLMRICDVYKIPLATNPRTAELLLMSLAINN